MDIGSIATQIGSIFGIQPSTLVLFIMIIGTAANAGARLIPQDAVGFWGSVRKVCSIVGVYIPSRVSSGVTVTDVANATIKTRPDIAAEAASPTTPPTK